MAIRKMLLKYETDNMNRISMITDFKPLFLSEITPGE